MTDRSWFEQLEWLEYLDDGILLFTPEGMLGEFNGVARNLFEAGGETLAFGLSLWEIASRLMNIGYPTPEESTGLLNAVSDAAWTQRHEVTLLLKSGKHLTAEFRRTASGFTMVVLKDTTSVWRLRLKLEDSLNTAITVLADLAEYRDTDSRGHILRVARLSYELTRCLSKLPVYSGQIDDPFLQHIGTASKLHDIGKVGIPDSVLLKAGLLDDHEWLIMTKHAQLGGETLRKASELMEGDYGFRLAAQIAFCHHERWDGKGYPFGLEAEAIPLAARIVAVADVYDALTNPRPHKTAWPPESAMDYLLQNTGSQFDPAVVAALRFVLAERKAITETRWRSEMSSQCAAIDADHKQLLILLNQMQLPENREDRIATGFVLDELITYTFSHFTREESLMQSLRFPGMSEHLEIHNRMRTEVIHLSRKLRYAFTPAFGGEVSDYLNHWLTRHILEDDKQYFPLIHVPHPTASGPLNPGSRANPH